MNSIDGFALSPSLNSIRAQIGDLADDWLLTPLFGNVSLRGLQQLRRPTAFAFDAGAALGVVGDAARNVALLELSGARAPQLLFETRFAAAGGGERCAALAALRVADGGDTLLVLRVTASAACALGAQLFDFGGNASTPLHAPQLLARACLLRNASAGAPLASLAVVVDVAGASAQRAAFLVALADTRNETRLLAGALVVAAGSGRWTFAQVGVTNASIAVGSAPALAADFSTAVRCWPVSRCLVLTESNARIRSFC